MSRGNKRRGGASFGRHKGRGGKPKRKQYNLLTLRQKKDFQEFGDHPVDDRSDTVRNYTKVEENPKKTTAQVMEENSSDESDEEMPMIKQLMAEIGMNVAGPESEEEEEEEEDGDDGGHEIADDKSDKVDDSHENDDNERADEHCDVLGNNTPNSQANSSGCIHTGNRILSGEEEDEHRMYGQEKENEEDVGEAESQSKEEDEVEDENDSDEEDGNDGRDNDELQLKESDPFTQYFELDKDISGIAENNNAKWSKTQIKVPVLGQSVLMYKDKQYLPEKQTGMNDLHKLNVKERLCTQVRTTNTTLTQTRLKGSGCMSRLQRHLFGHINTYQDLLYPRQDFTNMEEIRLVYCVHAVNHILKTRSRVIAHNTKLKNKKENMDDDIEYRDQGLTRPKVLIVLPYRDRALKVVRMMVSLLSASQQANVSNLKRFESEFSELESSDQAKSYKTEDFKKMFEGNTDDNFRVGLSVAKKSLRLYSPFYESDVILASPLGLRSIIGLEGDKDRDYDFLSSIEVLIVDQADVYLMQNWEYVIHVFKHLHLQPKESHGVDFSRVRMWAINGWSKHYRQTLMFSSILLPELLTVFNKHCHNYTGQLLVQRDGLSGSIRSSMADSPQIFHRVACDSADSLAQRQAKFEYFKKRIIPYHTSAGMKQTLIYCNYYSFVMLRNYFREAETNFLFINEYDDERHIRNTRIHFRKRHPHFMLYTERLHFHYRFRLRAIHHILWFDLPQYPHFYPELVNLMETVHQSCTTTALFTRFEGQKLMEIVGKGQASHMMTSEKSVNMITVS